MHNLAIAAMVARISVRPRWVGLLDFADRMPSALGGLAPRRGE